MIMIFSQFYGKDVSISEITCLQLRGTIWPAIVIVGVCGSLLSPDFDFYATLANEYFTHLLQVSALCPRANFKITSPITSDLTEAALDECLAENIAAAHIKNCGSKFYS